MQKLIFGILFCTLMACNSAKKAHSNTSVPLSAATDTTKYRLGISFYSIGTGIDGAARQQMLEYVSSFEQRNSLKLNVEKVSWGREGEVDYCFRLSELSKKQQDKFVAEVKELLKKSTRIHYKENTDCSR